MKKSRLRDDAVPHFICAREPHVLGIVEYPLDLFLT
ncbi:hypothetical protein PSO31014_03823 [Pandoraea soli]|uniref:Transposase n=1 Tax=Pandoraea soli TaxID=2508293 RepID=A0ABY6WE27_9BURK|nr:hypothetical protein PSO31014_03823 [Pandoraea soli]